MRFHRSAVIGGQRAFEPRRQSLFIEAAHGRVSRPARAQRLTQQRIERLRHSERSPTPFCSARSKIRVKSSGPGSCATDAKHSASCASVKPASFLSSASTSSRSARRVRASCRDTVASCSLSHPADLRERQPLEVITGETQSISGRQPADCVRERGSDQGQVERPFRIGLGRVRQTGGCRE